MDGLERVVRQTIRFIVSRRTRQGQKIHLGLENPKWRVLRPNMRNQNGRREFRCRRVIKNASRGRRQGAFSGHQMGSLKLKMYGFPLEIQRKRESARAPPERDPEPLLSPRTPLSSKGSPLGSSTNSSLLMLKHKSLPVITAFPLEIHTFEKSGHRANKAPS